MLRKTANRISHQSIAAWKGTSKQREALSAPRGTAISPAVAGSTFAPVEKRGFQLRRGFEPLSWREQR
jgi:hypothetical protein